MAHSGLDQFTATLKGAGMRSTPLRRRIYSCLAESSEPLTTNQIISAMDNAHFVSVYRSLDALTRIGVLKQVPIGLKHRYELSDAFKPHHHHITCEVCGRSVAIENSEVESLMERITRDAGLQPTKHHFEAYGVCNNH